MRDAGISGIFSFRKNWFCSEAQAKHGSWDEGRIGRRIGRRKVGVVTKDEGHTRMVPQQCVEVVTANHTKDSNCESGCREMETHKGHVVCENPFDYLHMLKMVLRP